MINKNKKYNPSKQIEYFLLFSKKKNDFKNYYNPIYKEY